MGDGKTVRWKFLGTVLFSVAAIGLAIFLANAALKDHRQSKLQTIIKYYVETEAINPVQEKVLAEAYWRRNPDVAADQVFGVDGRLGVFGPREHFSRHGHSEGRAWGP